MQPNHWSPHNWNWRKRRLTYKLRLHLGRSSYLILIDDLSMSPIRCSALCSAQRKRWQWNIRPYMCTTSIRRICAYMPYTMNGARSVCCTKLKVFVPLYLLRELQTKCLHFLFIRESLLFWCLRLLKFTSLKRRVIDDVLYYLWLLLF